MDRQGRGAGAALVEGCLTPWEGCLTPSESDTGGIMPAGATPDLRGPTCPARPALPDLPCPTCAARPARPDLRGPPRLLRGGVGRVDFAVCQHAAVGRGFFQADLEAPQPAQVFH